MTQKQWEDWMQNVWDKEWNEMQHPSIKWLMGCKFPKQGS